MQSQSQTSTSQSDSEAKTARRSCSFRKEWLNKGSNEYFSWVAEVRNQPTKANCTLCSLIISIESEGAGALKKHQSSKKHLQLSNASGMCKAIAGFFPPISSHEADLSAVTELALAYHAVMHHHSYLSTECGIKVCKKVFTDSKISDKIQCGRTKVEMLVVNVLAPYSIEKKLHDLGEKYYAVSSDASNSGTTKCFPLNIQFFNKTVGMVQFLLDFYDDPKDDSSSIFNQIKSRLIDNGLNLKNMSSYAADNASVNYGVHKSVYQNLLQENSLIVKNNCNCHVIHNMAKYAFKTAIFDVEVLVDKVYAEFSMSSTRVAALADIFDFKDMEYSSMLKNVATRWLSLSTAVERLLKNWEALKIYFIDKGEEQVSPVIWSFIEDQVQKVSSTITYRECYIYFLHSYITHVSTSVKVLESETVTSTELYPIMEKLLNELESRKQDHFYGFLVQKAFKTLSEDERLQFSKHADKVYQRSIEYLTQRFDFQNTPFKSFQIFSLKNAFTFNELAEFAEKFNININGDALYSEYCILTKIKTELSALKCPIDKMWVQFFTTVEAPELQKMVEFVLSVFISQAQTERIFSIMKNTWTDERNRLSVETVKAEMQVKTNFNMNCEAFSDYIKTNKELIAAAKSNQKYVFKKK